MTARRRQVLHGEFGVSHRLLQGDEAVSLREAARRIGVSYGYARKLVMVGKFPIPHLPRLGPLGHFRFSPSVLNDYLHEASTAEARTARR